MAAHQFGREEGGKVGRGAKESDPGLFQEPQLGLFASEAGLVFKELRDMDLDRMTPLEAMIKLQELKKRVDGG